MAFKDQLLGAVKSAVDSFNSGVGDNESVIKAAEAYDFNAKQTERLVESFNTAKTISFYKQASDRTSNFTTASKEVVLGALFSGEKKAAAVVSKTSTFDYDFSCYDGVGYESPADLEKKAAFDFGVTPVEQHRSLDDIARSFYRENGELRKAASVAKSALELQDVYYGDTIRKIAYELSKDIAYKNDVPDAIFAFRNSGVQGDTCERIVDDVVGLIPGQDKTAADRIRITRYDADHPNVMELFKYASDVLKHEFELTMQADTLEKMANDAEQEFLSVIGVVQPIVEDPIGDLFPKQASPDSIQDGREIVVKSLANTGAAGASRLIGAVNDSYLANYPVIDNIGTSYSNSLSGLLADLSSAAIKPGPSSAANKVTNRLINKQRQLILDDMINIDPVISGANPTTVADLYKTIVDTAPDVALDRSIVRSILREAVNSVSFSPYDAKSIAEVQNFIVKNRNGYVGDKK